MVKPSFWRFAFIRETSLFYIDELSMNPRVRSSPFSPPPADELVLTADEVFSTRRRRLFFTSIHLLALAGLYFCVTGQVKLYTVLFGKSLGSYNIMQVHPPFQHILHIVYTAKFYVAGVFELSFGTVQRWGEGSLRFYSRAFFSQPLNCIILEAQRQSSSKSPYK